jgi:hypothetical protein
MLKNVRQSQRIFLWNFPFAKADKRDSFNLFEKWTRHNTTHMSDNEILQLIPEHDRQQESSDGNGINGPSPEPHAPSYSQTWVKSLDTSIVGAHLKVMALKIFYPYLNGYG